MIVSRFPSVRRRRWRYLERLAKGVLAVVVAGMVVVGRYAASVPLPPEPVVAQASVLYYSDGRTVLARVGADDRTDVPLGRVPLDVRRAVLAAEDRDFYHHMGISARGVVRAGWADTVGGGSEGASTITQQYVRNAYLTQQRTAARKAREAVLAVKVEARYTKDQVLERYLNTVYFGRGAYGIEAAAVAYFGVPAERLTLAQGAVLASLIKDPWNFDPAVDPQAAHDRWHWVIASMESLNWAKPADVRYPVVAPRSGGASAGPLGLIVDQVEHELVAHGITSQQLHTGGLRVVTTIDPTVERAALDQVTAARRGQPADLRAALVALDPATGAVRGYYGGDRGVGYFDDAVAPRPPASTFKPIVLAAALQRGVPYSSRWDGTSPQTFPGRHGVPLHNHDEVQCHACPLDVAMVRSLNTPFYALTELLGPAQVRTLAVALGVADTYQGRRSLVDDTGGPEPGNTRADICLGIYPVTPADLATVYATFAAGGIRAERHFVESVRGEDGGKRYTATPRRVRVLPENVASAVTTVLAEVVDAHGPVPGRPAAGKTGTQQYGDTVDNSDAWMAGYTPQLATAVWVGRAVPGPIRDAAGRPIEGDTMPAALWSAFLTQALAGQPAAALPDPTDIDAAYLKDGLPVRPAIPSSP